jgi:uncharacterized repeat protein (TIGR01451 family)
VQGNLIGVNAAGGALGNGSEGVLIGGAGNTIGGTAAGAANVIGNNRDRGVDDASGQGNLILSNSIFSNTSLGIDLGSDGVTPNDLGDADAGANNRQNYPVITSATISGDSTTIVGTLNSTANATFLVQFFGNTVANASGFGEGETLMGFANVPTDPNGNGSFNVTFPGAPKFVAATATDSSDNTSEFSHDVATTSLPADLSITDSDSPDPVTAGADLTYTLTVHTAGPGDASNVMVSDPLPAGTSFVSASGGGSLSAGTVTWSLGTIAANAVDKTLSLVVHVDAAQTAGLSSTATVSSSTTDPVSDNDSDVATAPVRPPASPSADLSVTSSAAPNPVAAGQEVTFQFTVSDAGPSPATGVILTQTLPQNATFVSATGGVTPVNGKLIFELGNLPSGSATVTVVVHPDPGTATLSTTATVGGDEADPNLQNNSAAQVTTVLTPPGVGPTSVGPTGDGPTVVRLQRFGFHRQRTFLVVYFNADALEPVRASDVSNYQVTTAGADGVFGTKDDKSFDVRRATYDASRSSVTLAFDRRLYLYQRYQIRVKGAAPNGLADADDRYLDGDGDGRPGGDHVVRFDRRILAGRASKAPGAASSAQARRSLEPTVKASAVASHPLEPHRSVRHFALRLPHGGFSSRPR